MHPLPSLNEINLRCWHWRGASGRHYIHSVYGPATCPPFPGAVYVAVKRRGDLRHALAVGSFSDFWNASAGVQAIYAGDADEIHVHLLARSPAAIITVIADIQAAMNAKPRAEARPLLSAQQHRSAA
ncbi:MAG TPA: hypothetical protein VKA79_05730 [Aestuariivirgaceae bacterium]|nr:hypothetical protein [Aestuariivirgaceae bacterium]